MLSEKWGHEHRRARVFSQFAGGVESSPEQFEEKLEAHINTIFNEIKIWRPFGPSRISRPI